MTYGVHDSSGPLPLRTDQTEQTGAPLAAYAEDDDVATRQIQVPRSDFKWIVQLTPLDRPMMDTAQLVAELLDGTRVHRDTLVWRGGMDDWQPVGTIGDLPFDARQAATVAPAARRRARRGPQRAVLISLAVAISATAMAIVALSRRGAFDPSDPATNGAEGAQPQALPASRTAVRALEPSERAEAVPVEPTGQASGVSSSALLE